MGYDGFRRTMKKADVLNHYLAKKVWFNEEGHHSQEIVKHSNSKDGVWAVYERNLNGKMTDRWVALLKFEKVNGSIDVGWAVKVISEQEGPLYYNVPKSILNEKALDKNEDWRKEVAKFQRDASRDTLRWNKIRKMIKSGDKVFFGEGTKVDYGTFVQFFNRSLLVEANGIKYRAGKSVVDVDKTLLEIRRNV